MHDPPITHTELARLADDPEAIDSIREHGRFRVLPPYRLISFIVPVAAVVLIFALTILAPVPASILGLVLALPAWIALTMGMLRNDRNAIRRDASAYLRHHIIPCIVCGTDRGYGEQTTSCRGCATTLDLDSLRVLWAMRTEATMLPVKNDPDGIRRLKELHNLSYMLAGVPLLPVPISIALDALAVPRSIIGQLFMPMLILCMAVPFLPVYLLARAQKSNRRHAPDLNILFCPQCMHDLRGLPDEGVCPECARIYSAPRVRARWWLFDLRWIIRNRKKIANAR